jgi:hypothetical protein
LHRIHPPPVASREPAISLQPRIISAALASAVRIIYPSEFGADLTVPGNSAERYYRDKMITRRFLAEKAAEYSDLRYIMCVNGRLTEWASFKHFGIHTEKRSARIVGTKDMEQSLLGVEEYVAAFILEAPLHYVEHHAEKNADKINCTAHPHTLSARFLCHGLHLTRRN